MGVYLNSDYKADGFGFPSTNINPKLKKEKKYCVAWAKSIYSNHVKGRAGIPYGELSAWDEQRLYGKGAQSRDQYRSITMNESSGATSTDLETDGGAQDTLEGRRKGWKNVNDQIVSPASKIKDVFHGIFDNQDYEIDTDTIDINSGAIKDRAKYGLLTQTLFAKELARLRAIGNIPETQKDFVPRNVTDLEMYEASGGFKLQIAKSMEKIIRHTFQISDWDNVLKKKLLDDVLDIGYIALREVYDNDTFKTKVKYVDPSCLTIQYSKEDDYEDADWCGYYTTYTISQLEQQGFSRDELYKIAKDWSGKLNNPSVERWPQYETANSLGGYDYDFYRVPVYEVEWIDSDMSRYLKYNSRNGSERIKAVDYDADPNNYEKKEIVNHSTRVVYKCKWIIGTDKAFDYGISNDQIRPLPSKPVLSYRVIKVTENPIMKRLIPVFDKMQLAWLRYQNALIMSAGGGWAVNVRLLSNITLGKEKLSFKKVFEIMKNNSILFYSDTPVNGQYQGGAVNPVTPLPSMLKDEIANAIQEFEYSMKQVEHLTGLTPVALGGTPEERAGKGTTELSFSATQNVMRPIISNVMELKSRIANSAMLHSQMLIRGNKRSYDAYTDVIGEMDVAALKSAIHENTRYGIQLRAKPTEQDWQEINVLIQEAMTLGRDGVTTIDISDALDMYEMKDSGMNLSEMRMKLSYKIRKSKEEAQAKALQTQKFQAEADAKLTQQKAQQEAQGKQMDAKFDSDKVAQEHQYKMKEENFKANKEYKELVMKFAHEEDMVELEAKLNKYTKQTV